MPIIPATIKEAVSHADTRYAGFVGFKVTLKYRYVYFIFLPRRDDIPALATPVRLACLSAATTE